MKRTLFLPLTLLLFGVLLAVPTDLAPVACTASATDNFSSGNYSGGAGWVGNWTEATPTGGVAETDGPTVGNIRVVNGALRFVGVNGTDPYLFRQVDLNNATSAQLAFSLGASGTLEEDGTDQFQVQISNNGGASWTNLATYTGDNGAGNKTISITNFAAPNVRIRFGILQGALEAGEFFTIDNVSITTTCNTAPDPAETTVCNPTGTEIRGTVYEDYNYDGDFDAGEGLHLNGISVRLTAANGTTQTTTTNATGQYSFGGLTAGQRYRLEFTGVPVWLGPTRFGPQNGTTVQFVQPGNCADLGVANPGDYCQSNPPIGVTCFGEGPFNGGNSNDIALVRLPYSADGHDFNGTTKTATHQGTNLLTVGQIGAIYGIAWQRHRQRMYLGAFHKRFAGFGPAGPDAIYQVDLNGNVTGTLELDALTGTTNVAGGNVHDFTTMINGEPMDLGTNNAVFAGVGKRSLGDLDISDDGSTLYVVNLFNRRIYALNIASGVAAQTTLVNSWAAPDPTGAQRHRPFALKFYEGQLWLGSVDQNGSNAYVHTLNPTTGAWTLRHTVPLNYTRQQVIGSAPNGTRNADWRGWEDVPNNVNYVQNDLNEIGYPQPLLSDIEFDGRDLILGFRDRFGDQSSYGRFINQNDANANKKTFVVTAGDLLRVCRTGTGGFVTETGNTGACPGVSGLPSSGPGGAEFYHWDIYSQVDEWNTQQTNGALHWETTQGGLLQVAGKPSVYSTALDPFDDFSGGYLKFDNTTGRREGTTDRDRVLLPNLTGGYTLFDDLDFSGGALNISGEIGKANGLGDLEAFCATAPLEIGNYVWRDNDNDGIQDADEPGIAGVVVQLYRTNGTLVASATTNVNGQYYFNTQLAVNTAYYVVFGNTTQYTNNRLVLGNQRYLLTTANASTGINQDAVDSDAVQAANVQTAINGRPYLAVTTGAAGFVDHTLDAGFRPCLPRVVSATPSVCNPTTNTYSLSVRVDFDFVPTGNLQILFGGTTYTVTPFGAMSQTFVLNNVTARGLQPLNVTARFANFTDCTHTLNSAFTPPPSCRSDLSTEELCQFTNGGEVQLFGNPITNDNPRCLTLADKNVQAADADSLLLWVFARNNQPTSVTFTSPNGLNVVVPQSQGIAAGGNGFYYRVKVAADGSGSYCARTAGNNQNNERSFGAFVFYSPPEGNGAVSTVFNGEYLFYNSQTATQPGVEDCAVRTLNVAPGNEPQRDILLQIAVDDLEANDPRTVDFRFTAGSQVQSFTRSGPTFTPDNGGSLGIYEFTLTNVPQSVTSVEVQVCSKQVNNGQSLFFTGVIANSDDGCRPCAPTITLTEYRCDNNNTPADLNDDFYTVQVVVTTPDPAATQYRLLRNTNPDGTGGTVIGTYAYGPSVVIGQNRAFRADGTTTYRLTVRDVTNAFCDRTVTTSVVGNCSGCPPQTCGTVVIGRNFRGN